jgi:DNA-binding MarR family transcriptional regulator
LPRVRKARTKVSPREWRDANYGELADSVGFLLRRAQLAVLGDLIAALEPLDLSPAQFSVLVLIEANPDLAQSDLCAALGIQRPNFVSMLDELEARQLTRRCASRLDRRIKTLALTPVGDRLLRRALTIHDAHEATLLKRLRTSGVHQLERLLKRLV